MASFTAKGLHTLICVNTGCIMSLINRQFLKEFALNAELQLSDKSVSIQGISIMRFTTNEWVMLDIFVPGTIQKECATVYIH